MFKALRYLIFILISFFIFSCQNQHAESGKLPGDLVNNPKSAKGADERAAVPVISFAKTEHDFGRVIQGEKITYNFQFTNSGDADLIVTRVSASCGCTIPAFTRDPIKPGENGVIRITFDSENRMGFQNKIITVVSNSLPANQNLRIKAQVISPEKL
jgi:hypothetical protein